jgi:hypothetical protein
MDHPSFPVSMEFTVIYHGTVRCVGGPPFPIRSTKSKIHDDRMSGFKLWHPDGDNDIPSRPRPLKYLPYAIREDDGLLNDVSKLFLLAKSRQSIPCLIN